MHRKFGRLGGGDVVEYPVPDWCWDEFGKQCGPRRNSQMVKRADACLAFWDGKSSGTKDTFQKARSAGLLTVVNHVEWTDGGYVIADTETTEPAQTGLSQFEGGEQ
jgi:hypothetical protein